MMATDWISVKRKLPKNMQRVWASFVDSPERREFTFSDALIFWRDKKGKHHWTRDECTPLERRYVVTHWQLLPDPPVQP